MKLSLIFLAFCAILPAQMPQAQVPQAQAAPPAATDPNAVVLTIGDRKITAGEFFEMVKALPQQYQQTAMGAGRRDFARNLVELQVLAEQAVKLGLDKESATQHQIEFQRDNILAQAMFLNLQQTSNISDAEIQAYYDQHKADYETLTARHILIRVKGAPMPATPGKPELTDDEARAKAEALRKRIVAGEDFATIAKAESDDTSSGEKGGDLGEFKKGMMVPPFEAAAFALKPGDISEPVLTPFGYHIIQVQTHTTKSLADVKPEILAQLRPNEAREAVKALTEKTSVNYNDGFFGPAPVPPPVPPVAKAPAAPTPATTSDSGGSVAWRFCKDAKGNDTQIQYSIKAEGSAQFVQFRNTSSSQIRFYWAAYSGSDSRFISLYPVALAPNAESSLDEHAGVSNLGPVTSVEVSASPF